MGEYSEYLKLKEEFDKLPNKLPEDIKMENEPKKPSRTIIRLIVIEGDPEWVQQTLDRSLLKFAGSSYPPEGMNWPKNDNKIRCTSLVDKPTDMIGKKWEEMELVQNGPTEQKEST